MGSICCKTKGNHYKKITEIQKCDTAKNSLKETGDLSHYQFYKSSTVSKFLLRALDKIKDRTYGLCDVCKKVIPLGRLDVVPAALSCVEFDEKK